MGFFQLPLLPEALLGANGFALLRASLSRSSKPGTFDDTLLDAYREAWSQPGAVGSMLHWYRAMALARPLSTPVSAPTLLLWGGQDVALEPALADEALRYCAQGHLIRLPEATHWLHHAQPVRVAAELCDFFARDGVSGELQA